MKPNPKKVKIGWTHKQYLKGGCDHMLIFWDRESVHDFDIQVEIRPVATKKRKPKP